MQSNQDARQPEVQAKRRIAARVHFSKLGVFDFFKETNLSKIANSPCAENEGQNPDPPLLKPKRQRPFRRPCCRNVAGCKGKQPCANRKGGNYSRVHCLVPRLVCRYGLFNPPSPTHCPIKVQQAKQSHDAAIGIGEGVGHQISGLEVNYFPCIHVLETR